MIMIARIQMDQLTDVMTQAPGEMAVEAVVINRFILTNNLVLPYKNEAKIN